MDPGVPSPQDIDRGNLAVESRTDSDRRGAPAALVPRVLAVDTVLTQTVRHLGPDFSPLVEHLAGDPFCGLVPGLPALSRTGTPAGHEPSHLPKALAGRSKSQYSK